MTGENKQPERTTPPRANRHAFPGMLFGAILTGLGTGVSVTGELMPYRPLAPQAVMIWAIIAAAGVLMMGLSAHFKQKSMIMSGIGPIEAENRIENDLKYCMWITSICTILAASFTANFLSSRHSSIATGIIEQSFSF